MRFGTPLSVVFVIAVACSFVFYLESEGLVEKEDFGVKSGAIEGAPKAYG